MLIAALLAACFAGPDEPADAQAAVYEATGPEIVLVDAIERNTFGPTRQLQFILWRWDGDGDLINCGFIMGEAIKCEPWQEGGAWQLPTWGHSSYTVVRSPVLWLSETPNDPEADARCGKIICHRVLPW